MWKGKLPPPDPKRVEAIKKAKEHHENPSFFNQLTVRPFSPLIRTTVVPYIHIYSTPQSPRILRMSAILPSIQQQQQQQQQIVTATARAVPFLSTFRMCVACCLVRWILSWRPCSRGGMNGSGFPSLLERWVTPSTMTSPGMALDDEYTDDDNTAQHTQACRFAWHDGVGIQWLVLPSRFYS